MYNIDRKWGTQKCVLPKLIDYTTSSVKAYVVYFYICLSVHIMYIIHNKAIFMVIDNINPIIRNSKNSTISIHLLTLNISWGVEVTHTSAFISFLSAITISYLYIEIQVNVNKFLHIFINICYSNCTANFTLFCDNLR